MSCPHRQRTLALLLVMAVLITIPVGIGTAEHTTSEGVFDVEITAVTSPVAEGDEVVVTATVENTGAERDSQQIHLKNSANVILDSVASPPLTLEPGEREEITLTWQTDPGDAGTHDLRVSSNNEAPEQSIVIERADTGEGDDSEDDTGTDTEDDSRSPNPASGVSIQAFADSSSGGPGITGGQGGYLDHSYFQIEGTSAQIRGYEVQNVTFTEPTDGFVLISDRQTLPTGVDQTEDVVALYDIGVSKQVASMEATIEFRLDDGALDGADAEHVVVRRWNGSAWTDLPTNTTVDGAVHIVAETSGFSVFAVTTGNETAATTSGSQGTPAEESEPSERVGNQTDEANTSEPAGDEETDEANTSEPAGDDAPAGNATNEGVDTETGAGEHTESAANATGENEETLAAMVLLSDTGDTVEGPRAANDSQTGTTQNSNSQALEVGIIVTALLGTVLLVTYRRRTQ